MVVPKGIYQQGQTLTVGTGADQALARLAKTQSSPFSQGRRLAESVLDAEADEIL